MRGWWRMWEFLCWTYALERCDGTGETTVLDILSLSYIIHSVRRLVARFVVTFWVAGSWIWNISRCLWGFPKLHCSLMDWCCIMARFGCYYLCGIGILFFFFGHEYNQYFGLTSLAFSTLSETSYRKGLTATYFLQALPLRSWIDPNTLHIPCDVSVEMAFDGSLNIHRDSPGSHTGAWYKQHSRIHITMVYSSTTSTTLFIKSFCTQDLSNHQRA